MFFMHCTCTCTNANVHMYIRYIICTCMGSYTCHCVFILLKHCTCTNANVHMHILCIILCTCMCSCVYVYLVSLQNVLGRLRCSYKSWHFVSVEYKYRLKLKKEPENILRRHIDSVMGSANIAEYFHEIDKWGERGAGYMMYLSSPWTICSNDRICEN